MTAPGRAQELAGAGPRAARLLSPFADDEVPVALARLSCGQAINDGGLKLSDKDLLFHVSTTPSRMARAPPGPDLCDLRPICRRGRSQSTMPWRPARLSAH